MTQYTCIYTSLMLEPGAMMPPPPTRYFVEGTRGEGTCCEEMNLVLSIPNDDNTMFSWLEQIYISQLNLGGGAFIQGCI